MFAILIIDTVKVRAIIHSTHHTQEEADAALLRASFETVAADHSLSRDTAALDDSVVIKHRS